MTLLNILVAYPYFKPDLINCINQNIYKTRFLLDSGAFTAFTLGKNITLNEYCDFVQNLPFKPWRYFTLDVIGDGKKTWKNYNLMLERGFNPLPIFTRGEDINMLDEYYKTSDVVGIGGNVAVNSKRAYVNGIMKYNKGRNVHLLGFTEHPFIKYYKPYMCDSSSYLSARRFAMLSVYKGFGQFYRLSKKDFVRPPNKEILDKIALYGVDPYKLAKNDSWIGGRSLSHTVTVRSWVHYSLDVEKNIGTKLFLASSTADDLLQIYESYDYLLNKGLI